MVTLVNAKALKRTKLTVAEARETSINNGAGRCRDILPMQLQSSQPTTNNQSIPHLLSLRSPKLQLLWRKQL